MFLVCACVVVTSTAWFKDPRNGAFVFLGVGLLLGAYLYTSHARRILRLQKSLRVDLLGDTLVIVAFDRWSSITKKGISLALQLTGQIRVLHVGDEDSGQALEALWQRNVVSPLSIAGKKIPELVILKATEGYALSPMADYILAAEREEPNRQIVVVVPELAVRHWWQRPLHNYRNRFLKLMLSTRGSQRIMIIDVPWYL
jgi:hypothetical protein